MTFATAKELPASRRFMLAKLTPALDITDDLAVISGSDYGATLDLPEIEDVKRNAVTLTRVTSITANDQYTYNASTGAFVVRLSAAPSDSNVIVAYFDFYFTGEIDRLLPKDPTAAESGSNPVVKWLARITKYPDVRQTIKNVSSGIVSIGDSSLSLIDTDGAIFSRLSENYSWYNKDVKIWLCIDDVSNIQRIYTGKSRQVSVNNSVAVVSVFDTFAAFSSPAFMGDNSTEAIYQRSSALYPNLMPEHHGRPSRYIFGQVSQRNFSENYGTAANPRRSLKEPTLAAVCTSYDETVSTSTNRNWSLCRTSSDGIELQDFGTWVRGRGAGGDAQMYLSGHNLSIGETVKYTVGGLTEYGTVIHVGDWDISGSTYNIAIDDRTNTNPAPWTGIGSYTPMKKVAVAVDNGAGQVFYYRQTEHYSHSSVLTSGGNLVHFINFQNNFEAFWSGDPDAPNPLDPAKHKVLFTVSPASKDTHGNALKKMIQEAGLSVLSSSFTAADSALSAKTRFCVPYHNESSYGSYLKYIEDLLASTLGYITINSSDQIEYHLFAAPSGSLTVDDSKYLSKSLQFSADYNDIITGIVASNKHVERFLGIDLIDTAAYIELLDNHAKYLHGVDNVIDFEHLLERIDGRLSDILAYLSRRRGVWSFDTATINMDSKLGDDVLLDGNDVKITSISKDGSRCRLEAEDLKGL